jgi:hypothetical protein
MINYIITAKSLYYVVVILCSQCIEYVMQGENEKGVHKKVYNCTIIIIRYFQTYFSILSHPQKTFENLRSGVLTKPGTFLVINILLSYSVGHIISYELPQFPFSIPLPLQDPQTQKLTGNYLFLIGRFIIGIAIFTLLLKWFLKFKNSYNFVSLIWPILCYSSVIYLPFILIKTFLATYYTNYGFDLLSASTSGIPLKLNLSSVLKFLLYPLIRILLPIWWLWLVYTGTKFAVKNANIKKGIFFSYIFFFLCQTFITSVSFIVLNYSTIKGALIIASDQVGIELAGNPPNYLKASLLAREVSDNEKLPIPEYIRYLFKLKKAIYLIAYYKGDEALTSEAMKGFKGRNYPYVRNLLDGELRKYSANNNQQKPLYYPMIKEIMDEAEKLRNSPTFVDLGGNPIDINVGIWFTLRPLSYPVYSIDSKKTSVSIYLTLPPSLIALFP